MKDLTQGNIFKTFFLFGFPLVLSGLLSETYNLIDTAIAGRFLGEQGLAAIGATSPLITFFSAIFWGFGSGVCIYVAKLFGQGKYKDIKNTVYTTYLFITIACVVVGVLCIALYKPLFSLLQIDESLHKDAFIYFAVYMAGFFAVMLSSNGLFLMNAFGIGSFPFYMSIISAGVNVIGNILCVVVFKTGVVGLAISTVLSAVIVDIFYICKFKKCLREMGADQEKTQISLRLLKRTFPFSVPNTAQQTVMYLATLLVSPLVNGLGVSATASYAVVLQVFNFVNSVYCQSSRSFTNYTAQCVGKGQTENIKKGVGAGLLQSVGFTLPFMLIACLLHKPVCSLFLKADASIETVEYSYIFCTNYLPFILFNSVNNIFHGLFRGSKATAHLFSTTCFGALTRFVASFILIHFYGMEGFFLGWAISWVLEAILCVTLYFIGKWKPKTTAY
jgi:putative MATE family efflux protein